MSEFWIGLPVWAVIALICFAVIVAGLVVYTGFNVLIERYKGGGRLVIVVNGLRRTSLKFPPPKGPPAA